MKTQIELILEQQDTKDSFLKELLDSVGVHIEGTLTWGAGITAFYGPVKDLLLNQDPKFTEVEIAMVFIAAVALVIRDNSAEIKKLVNLIKGRGLEPTLNKSVTFLKTVEDIGIKIAETSGFVVTNLLDIASFTFMFLPIIDAIRAYTNSEHLTMEMAPQYFKALLFSVGILSIKNLFNRLVRRLRELKNRNTPPDNLTEGVFTSDFIDYMDSDVFDEELEEVQLTSHASHKHSAGDHILEQEETEEEEDVDEDIAFNIIDGKYRKELRVWLEAYFNAQRRWPEAMRKRDGSWRDVEENIEFALVKVRGVMDDIIQVFKLYGLAYGNQYTTWVWEAFEEGNSEVLEVRNEDWYVPYDPEIMIPIKLIPWLEDLLSNEIDPNWEEWSFIEPDGNLDRYGRYR